MEKLKQNAELYGVREGSRVIVQWAVRWVGGLPTGLDTILLKVLF